MIEDLKLVTSGMRRLLQAAGGLVFFAGIQLFVFPEKTEDYFAWTIAFPLTAAFLGASYWASVMFEWGAARERVWAYARVGIPAVFVFTTMTFVTTMLHLDLFHLDSSLPLKTRLVTYGWIGIYSGVPLLMLLLIRNQLRAPGVDPPRDNPLPTWLRGVFVVQAVVLLLLGGYLFFASESAARLWPWPLTPLTAKAIAAWLLGIGVGAAHSVYENDFRRIRIAAWANIALVLLQLLAELRYSAALELTSQKLVIYNLFLLSLLLAGSYAAAKARALSPGRQ